MIKSFFSKAISLLTLSHFLSSCNILGSSPEGERLQRVKSSPQFDRQKGVFINKNPKTMDMASYLDMIKDYFSGKQERTPIEKLPEVTPNLNKFLTPSKEIKFIWLGHSTFMLHLEDQTILVDPVLSEYASPIPIFAKRFQDPVLKLEELPSIDVIVISHDHYYHLDMKTIKNFVNSTTQFIVPLGVGAHLSSWGVKEERITELDWWEKTTIASINYTCTPAQHFSGRTLKRNETLWASWAITSSHKNIFYSGDSGYSEHYQEIGKRIGPFDLAFLENGQYNKNCPGVHQTPEQAIQASLDLQAKVTVPAHWGMFELSSHDWFEPAERLTKNANHRQVKTYIPRLGELVYLNELKKSSHWWLPTQKIEPSSMNKKN